MLASDDDDKDVDVDDRTRVCRSGSTYRLQNSTVQSQSGLTSMYRFNATEHLRASRVHSAESPTQNILRQVRKTPSLIGACVWIHFHKWMDTGIANLVPRVIQAQHLQVVLEGGPTRIPCRVVDLPTTFAIRHGTWRLQVLRDLNA
jgi:hypothetical protein